MISQQQLPPASNALFLQHEPLISRQVGGSGGNTVTSILTSESVRRQALRVGMQVAAVIKVSDVLLAVA